MKLCLWHLNVYKFKKIYDNKKLICLKMFGQNNQQKSSLFGGGNNGGGFGGSSAPSFGGGGASTGFGGGGGFGGQTSSNFGGGGFAQSSMQPQNNTGGGLFGGQQNNQANQGGGGLFGGQTQGMGQQTQGFGGASSGFGNNAQTQGFGANTSGFSSGFGGNNTGGFGNNGAFGQNKPASNFGQPQMNQGAAITPFQQNSSFGGAPQGGGGLFNKTGNSFGGGGLNQPNSKDQIQFYEPQVMQATTQTIFSKTDPQFSMKTIQQDGADRKTMSLRFKNIRTEAKYELCSGPMLRLCDMRGQQTNQPQMNYEFAASQQWTQQKAQHPLPHKLAGGQPQGGMGMGGGMNQAPQLNKSASLFGGQPQSTGFGGATSSFGFNQQQPNQQNNTGSNLFGGASNNNQNQQNTGGLFGGGGQTQGFGQQGATTGFGANNTSSAFGGGLGLNNKPAQSNLFGGGTTSTFSNPAQPSTSGGLFGNNQPAQSNTGGLFGGANNQTQQLNKPATGGLFGNTGNQGQPATSTGGGLFGNTGASTGGAGGGGLFGNNNQSNTGATGGGLFGNNSQNNAKPGGAFGGGATSSFAAPSAGGTGGGLFGNNQSQTQQNTGGGGLFGGASKPAASNAGGLFGGGASAPASGGSGLFGSKPAGTGGGLFGGGASTTTQAAPAGGLGGVGGAPSGGLFGGGGGTSGGLFGNTQPKPANPGLGGGTSLFGGATSTQNPNPGGLFGAPSGGLLQNSTPGQGGQGAFTNMNPQQTAAPTNLNLQSLYNPVNDDPLGLRQGHLLAETPHMNFEEEMRKINEEAEKGRLESNRQFEYQREQIWASHAEIGYTSDYGITQDYFRRPSQAELEEEERQLEKYEREKERQYLMNQKSKNPVRGLQTMKSTFSARDGFQTQRSAFKQPESAFRPQNFQMSRQASAVHLQASPMQKNVSTISDYVPGRNMIRNPQSAHPNQIQTLETDFSKEIKNLSAVLPARELGNQQEKVFKMSFHQTYNVEDAIKRVQKIIQNEMNINIRYEQINFLHKSACLNREETLEDIERGKMDISIQIMIDPAISKMYKTCEYMIPKNSQEAQNISQSVSPQASPQKEESRDWLPLYPRNGHRCEPDYREICMMTKEQVASLPSFKLINDDFGEIEFLPPEKDPSIGIDLTNVDLRAFQIKDKMALGYEDFDGKFEKPRINTKLNIPANVTLFLKKDIKLQKLLNILQRQNDADTCKDNGKSEHLSYENGVWQFRVPHWSKWGLDDSDEEEGKEESKKIESQDIPNQKAQIKGAMQDVQQKTKQDIQKIKSQQANDLKFNVAGQNQVQVAQSKPIVSQNQIRYGSQAYNEQFVQRQNVMTQSQQLKENKPLPNPVKEKIMPTKYSRNKKVFAKIAAQKKRMEEFEKKLQQSELEYKRTEVEQEIKKLVPKVTKDFQGKMVKNQHHLQIHRGAKPCFRPNGQLWTFHNQIVQQGFDKPAQIETRQIVHNLKQVEGSKVDLTETMLGNVKIQRVYHDPLTFEKELQLKNVIKSDNQDFQTIYESPYFQALIQGSKIPMVDSEKTPKGIFKLLRDVAERQLSSQVKKQDHHDFYVICMLNALFGDPRIHLVHMHPTYRVHNNSNYFDKAMKLYEHEQYRDFKQSHECAKQRRNAVTELLRQICFIEFGEKLLHDQINKTHTEASLYDTVYQMLLNGQLTHAVKLLGKNGKNQLARLVAMSVSTQESTKSRISLVSNQFISQGQQMGFKNIVDLITCKHGENLRFAQSAKWQQVLCAMLLFQVPTQFALNEVIKNFDQLQQRTSLKVEVDGNEDVLLTLLKCYSGVELQAIDRLNSFKRVSCQRFQVQWLVQYVMRLYSEYENEVFLGEDTAFKMGVVTRDNFNLTSCRLVDQLVKAKNYKSAALVCLLMCDDDSLIKRKSLFEVIGYASTDMFDEENRDVVKDLHDFYLEKLQLPPKFIQVQVAMKQENNRNFTGAFNSWVEAQNFQKAHDVLMTHIVPKSLGSRPSLLETHYFQDSKALRGPLEFKYAERKFIDEALEKLTQGSSLIEHWGENGLLLMEILQMTKQNGVTEAQKLQKLLVLTKKVQSLGQSQLNCNELQPLRQSLSEKLLKIESELKAKKQPDSLMSESETDLLFDQTIRQMRNPGLMNRKFVSNVNFVSQNMY